MSRITEGGAGLYPGPSLGGVTAGDLLKWRWSTRPGTSEALRIARILT
jgi:hypothetical protein